MMSKSDIVLNIQYKYCKNKKVGVRGWLNYASRKQKADSSSIDEYNMLKDYALFSDKDSFLNEDSECYLWNNNGDINKQDIISNMDDMGKGLFYRGFLSFPPEFAINHGLITKADYYSLTNQFMPSLIMDMGLDINNVEWYCSLHRDTKHPHIHFCIFEKKQTKTNPRYPKSCIYKCKSNIANYLVDFQKFYELRDNTFSDITGTIDLNNLNKIKGQRLFSDKYRKNLNDMLLDLYNKLPKTGRIQYNSKNMNDLRDELDSIISYILYHDSTKYIYASYLKLLEEHQKELNQLYGQSNTINNRKYYNEQLNRLYTKIGNEILANYKIYQSMDIMEREKDFLKKNINDIKFKSRNYAKDETKFSIASDLYKICVLADLDYNQTKKVFKRWLKNSNYNYDVDSLISSIKVKNYDMSTQEFYSALKRLGYNYDRYSKLKSKNFYRQLSYRRFINRAINHLEYEKEKEEKQIVANIQFELEAYK